MSNTPSPLPVRAMAYLHGYLRGPAKDYIKSCSLEFEMDRATTVEKGKYLEISRMMLAKRNPPPFLPGLGLARQ